MRRLALPLLGVAAVTVAAAVVVWRPWQAPPPQGLLDRGRQALKAGDVVTARQYAERLGASGAADHQRMLEAELALRDNEHDRVLSLLDQIDGQGPLRLDAAFVRAQTLMVRRQPREAELFLALVLSERPDHAEAHRWAGILFYDQGDFPRAVEHLQRTADLLPADSRALRLAGLIHKDLERHGEAVAAYRESLRRDPRPRDAEKVRTEFAESLMALQEASEALEVLGEIDSPAAAAVRCEALISLGRSDEAITILDAALGRHRHHAELMRIRAELHHAAGELNQAARLLERVLLCDPHDLRCRNLLAQICEARGDSRAAQRHLQRMKATQQLMEAVQAKNREAMNDPWNAQVRLELADLCDRLGRPAMANMWRRAASVCPPRP